MFTGTGNQAHIEEVRQMKKKNRKKLFLYGISRNEKSGYIEIRPMNKEGSIIIRGAEDALFFISQILDCFQKV